MPLTEASEAPNFSSILPWTQAAADDIAWAWNVLGCHQAVPTWVTHIRIHEVRDESPADKPCAGRVLERFRLSGNAYPPAGNTAWLQESRGPERPAKVPPNEAGWLEQPSEQSNRALWALSSLSLGVVRMVRGHLYYPICTIILKYCSA